MSKYISNLSLGVRAFLKVLFPFLVCSAGNASVYLEQVGSLLPDKFTVIPAESNSDLGNKIDDVVLRILKTNTGKRFCGAITGDPSLMKNAFFAGFSQIQEAMSACRGSFANKVPYRIFPKSYYIVLTPSKNLKASGWTTPHNETILFFNINEFNTERLFRAIAHEIAISFDAKEKIGFSGVFDWTDTGIKQDQNTCNAQPLVTWTPIKQTFAAIRAFQIETQVASEAGYPIPEGFKAWNSQSCTDRFISLFPAVYEFSGAFAAENLVHSLSAEPIECLPNRHYSAYSIEEKILALKHLMFHFKDGTSKDACTYMSEAFPYKAVASFNGGPGPRIGGGGWITAANMDQKQKELLKETESSFGIFQLRAQDRLKKQPEIAPEVNSHE